MKLVDKISQTQAAIKMQEEELMRTRKELLAQRSALEAEILTAMETKTVPVVSKELGLTRVYIYKVLKRNKRRFKKAKCGAPRIPYTDQELIALYEKHDGVYKKIAQEVGVKSAVISVVFKNRYLRTLYPPKNRIKKEKGELWS